MVFNRHSKHISMKHIKLLALSAFAFLLLYCNKANAQNYLGVINSNYIGIMGADLQPASIVDSRFMVDINLFSFSVDAYQNAKYFDASVLPKRSWLYSLKKDTAWMNEDNLYDKRFHNVENFNDANAKSRGGYVNTQFDILNFYFNINRKIAIGFSAKVRMIANFDNVNPKVLKLAEESLDYSDLWNLNIDGTLLSENSMAWAEYGINYAQVVYDEGEHFFKVGGRLKFNQGIAASYAYSNDLEFNLLNADTATTLKGNIGFGYSDNVDKYFEDNNSGKNYGISDIYRLTSKLGVGVDLGVVYEWRPDWKDYKYDMDGETNLWRRDKNKYKIRVGASLLDLGGMRFKKASKSRNFSVNTTNLDLTLFDKANSPEEFTHVVDSLIQNDPDWKANEDTAETFYMHTPTALSLQFDWMIWKDFHLNATAYISLNSKKHAHNVRMPNQFSITPSYDYKWAGIGIPVSYNSYSGVRVGLGLRLGPLTVGVPDLKTLFPGGKIRGAGIYAGLRIPVLYGHPADQDNDKVSDKLDQCLTVPGVWSFRGCPDTDKDSIPDSKDDCPMTPGSPKFNGCPDTDGDGIPDKDDKCPEVAGLPEFNGCPDTDGDGIQDAKDDCPKVKGTPEFNGCPDTDGDGIPDKDDKCPDKPGPKEFNGCPDSDADGLPDFIDKCPNQPGPKENSGCPFADKDGDGVLDKDDKCPETAGPKENHGCPKIDKETQKVLQTAFDNLEFETAKAIIRTKSYPSLNKLAEVLKQKPNWELQLSGYTDNVGNARANLLLSKRRAQAVKDYLIGQGIEEKRLHVLYFGEKDPVASNSTAAGRQQNRRVEMEIIFK